MKTLKFFSSPGFMGSLLALLVILIIIRVLLKKRQRTRKTQESNPIKPETESSPVKSGGQISARMAELERVEPWPGEGSTPGTSEAKTGPMAPEQKKEPESPVVQPLEASPKPVGVSPGEGPTSIVDTESIVDAEIIQTVKRKVPADIPAQPLQKKELALLLEVQGMLGMSLTKPELSRDLTELIIGTEERLNEPLVPIPGNFTEIPDEKVFCLFPAQVLDNTYIPGKKIHFPLEHDLAIYLGLTTELTDPQPAGDGDVIVTSKRLIFSGEKTINIDYELISYFEIWSNALRVHSPVKKTADTFSLENPALLVGIVQRLYFT